MILFTTAKNGDMLSNKKIQAFIPTINPEQAKTFYRDILGLKLLSEDNYALEFDANGIFLRITTVETFTPQPFTVLGWNVDDISSIIKSLNDKDIFCEKYDLPGQEDSGVWTSPRGSKVAWFKDPDGNVLSLSESPS
jgi:catechol 2,3-dioxygenase-like lactoylglutathione lyase family enzyme